MAKKGKKAAKKAKKAAKKLAKKARKAARLAKKASPRRSAAKRTAPGRTRESAAAPTAARRRRRARQQPESLRLRAAGPGFTVADIDKSLAFYRDALGFTVKERWEEDGQLRGVELVAGSVSFWLSQDDWKKGRDRVKGVGFRMYCETAQDIDALAARVKAAGGALLEEPHDEPWGGRAFGVRDSDGFTITFASRLG
jgi:uncharacterized glyoxalase superfamily protein PhnB